MDADGGQDKRGRMGRATNSVLLVVTDSGEAGGWVVVVVLVR